MLTTEQVQNRTKDVTRRLGWRNLEVGEFLQGCRKCQGLKPGEKLERLCVIRVVSVRRERLSAMTDNVHYGLNEIEREGFRDHPTLGWPSVWVPWFCGSHKGCTPETEVTRIEFEYVDAQEAKA